jgi:hypothetical protein
MTTRSLSDWVGVVMGLFLPVERAIAALYGVLIPSLPPSAQAQMPSRPSGADKEKQRAQNEGGNGFGLAGRPFDRADGLPRRHCHLNPRFDPRVAETI